jgi:signal transduction histidine kinase/FixJ family two-component response regulator
MGELMRALDWGSTPLGPTWSWPHSLKVAVRIILTSRYAMFVWWGRELTNLYNDAYRPFLGVKHPAALGRPAREVWEEIWGEIGPRSDSVLTSGESTFDEALLLLMERHGYLEETYFTFSYSPLPDDTGGVGGIFCAVTEETERVIGQRRLLLLRELAAETAKARTPDRVCQIAADCLTGDRFDLPFAILYLVDPNRQRLRLAAAAGFDAGHPALAVRAVHSRKTDQAWPLHEVMEAGRRVLIDDLPRRFPKPLPTGPWSQPPSQAIVLPISRQGEQGPVGVLVAGLNPHRPFDDDFSGFVNLVAGQISAGIVDASAYEAERRRAEALAELDRAKTAFFSNVSHEFRTPLTLVLGPVEEALALGPEPAERQRLEVIQRNALRLLRLVNTLLDFLRIEAGRVDASFELVDLPAYTDQLASMFRSAFDRAGLTFDVDCPPLPDGVETYVDREMWERVVLNLVSNAFKFTLQGGVRISVDMTDAGLVELRVADSGIGISPRELPYLFERFHRVEGARGRTQEGSGIGLGLVNELVRLHGGAVRAESEPGRGSTFIVHLPVGRAHLSVDRVRESRATPATSVSGELFVAEALRWLPDGDADDAWPVATFEPELVHGPRDTHGARVLVIDDNADMRDYLKRLLAPQYVVEAFADASHALAAIAGCVPDLVLSDVMLPGQSGLDVLDSLRGNPATATVPVILLSARAGEEAKVEGLLAGANDYLVKPFSIRELLARIDSQLMRAKLRAQINEERERRFQAERRSREIAERVQRHLLVRDAVGMVLVEASLDDGPPRILEEVCRGFDWDWGVFWEVDALNGALRPIATWSRRGLDLDAFESATRATRFTPGDGLPGRVWATGKPMWIVDVRRHPAVARRGAASAQGLHSGIAVPVRSGGRVVAVLELMSQGRRERDRQLLKTLGAIAAKVGQFVERRRAEEILRRSEAAERAARLEAETAILARDEFVATVSHDLSNPLATIKGHVQLLRRAVNRDAAPPPAQLDSRLATMEGAATDIERLIGDLLDAARLQAGRQLDLRLQPADLVVLARRAADAYERLSDRHRLSVSTAVATASGVWDVGRVQRVLANLLANAIKYSPNGGDVEVSVDIDGDSAVLTVRDEGLGIPATDLPRVFERFHRGSNVERISGTGIGLAGAKNIVEQHGGSISVMSTEGQGTAVEVRLPLASDAGE